MARSFVRGVGKPRVKRQFGQQIARVTRNISRRIRQTGFRFSKGRKRVNVKSFGFKFNMGVK